MRFHCTFRTVTCLAALAAAPAGAQSLSERINTVIAQRQNQVATAKGPILRALLTTTVSVHFDQTKAKEAFAYLTSLRATMIYGGISDCDMEKGQLRCDANISIRPRGETKLGTKEIGRAHV